MDNTLVFTEIGFLAAENDGLFYRDAVSRVSNYDSDIIITIPYFKEDSILQGQPDTSTPLLPGPAAVDQPALFFDVLASDAQVLLAGSPIQSGQKVSFHDGIKPLSLDLEIRKTNGFTGEELSRIYTVTVEKAIYPEITLIDNPAFLNPPDAPAVLSVEFKDERDNTVPLATFIPQDGIDGGVTPDVLYMADKDGFGENDYDRDISVDFSTWTTSGDSYLADAKPTTQGRYYAKIPESDTGDFSFIDAGGFSCRTDDLSNYELFWDPDAVYLAPWGQPTNSGLSKEDPVSDLADALTIAAGSARFEIRAAEGDYDLGPGALINQNVSIYGGYSSDFSSRWNMESASVRHAHATIFKGTPPAGTLPYNLQAVLTYDSAAMIYDSSVLDGVIIKAPAGSEGGQNLTLAVRLTGMVSPIIRNCTIEGGGGVSGLSAAIGIINGTGTPHIKDNLIRFKSTSSTGSTAGILADSSTLSWITGNSIDCADSFSGDSSGILMDGNSPAEIHYNLIFAGDAGTESSGIRSNSSQYIRMSSNTIAGGASSGTSYGVSLKDSIAAYLFSNSIRTDETSGSVGIRINDTGAFGDYEVINNAIRVGSEGSSRGLVMENLAPTSLIFMNNLLDSQSATFVGIDSSLGPSIANDASYAILNNAFDNGSEKVQMQIDGGAAVDLSICQNGSTNLFGNIEASFEFDTEGRINSGLDANLAYGGGNAEARSFETGPDLFHRLDKDGANRTLDFDNTIDDTMDAGWSIGPYEYDTVSRPTVFYVTSAGGSDKNVLGTREHPFESVNWATAAADGRKAYGTLEFRVAEGTYAADMLSQDFDARYLGGYSSDFSTRDYVNRVSLLNASTSGIFNLIDRGGAFLIEGFTLESSNTGPAVLISLQGSSMPTIRYNRLEGNASNTSFAGIRVQDTAAPTVYGNTVNGGITSSINIGFELADDSTGLYRDNTINGGSPNTGSSSAITVSFNASPEINDNTLNGGSPSAGDSIILKVEGNANPSVRSNMISGGTATGGDAMGIYYSSDTLPGLGGLFEGNTVADVSSVNGMSMAVMINGSGTYPVFINNDITGGECTGAVGESVGIMISADAAPTLVGNSIRGNQDGTTNIVYGILVMNSMTGFVMEDNRIFMGIAVDESSGINAHVSQFTIQGTGQNIISGGEGARITGLRLETCANVSIEDTIITGSGTPMTTVESLGLFMDGSTNISLNGLEIQMGSGDLVSGIKGVDSNNVSLLNCSIAGGSAEDVARSIDLNNCDSSSITDIRITGGNAANTYYGLSTSNADNLLVERSDITIGSSDYSFGMDIRSSPSISIADSAVSGGNALTDITGIRLFDTTGSIQNCTIEPDGGTPGGNSTGLSLDTNGVGIGFDVSESTITGGKGANTVGVDINAFDFASIKDSTVSGSDPASTNTDISRGLKVNTSSNIEIRRNRVFGGSAAAEKFGIEVLGSDSLTLVNNAIHAGDSTVVSSFGVAIDGSTALGNLVANNTIYSGTYMGAGQSVALILGTGFQPQVMNNILIAGDGAGGGDFIGVWQIDASLPDRFHNNLILAVNKDGRFEPYVDNGGGSYGDAAILDSYFAVNGGGPPNHELNLISQADNPAAYFKRFTASGSYAAFLADDWSLSGGGSQNAIAGGADLSSYGFSLDITGTMTRTAAWSIGAYEF